MTITRQWNYQGDEPIPAEIVEQCKADAEEQIAYMGRSAPGNGTVTDAEGGQYRWEA